MGKPQVVTSFVIDIRHFSMYYTCWMLASGTWSWGSCFIVGISAWTLQRELNALQQLMHSPLSFLVLLFYATSVTFMAAFYSIKDLIFIFKQHFNVLYLYICVKMFVWPTLMNTDADWITNPMCFTCLKNPKSHMHMWFTLACVFHSVSEVRIHFPKKRSLTNHLLIQVICQNL